MGVYVLKFSACLFVFWLVYVLLLERQKMHRFKRFYLMSAFAGSIIIPLLSITYYVEPVVQDLAASPLSVPLASTFTETPIEDVPAIPLESILWYLYGLGVLLFSTRFIVNLVRLYNSISKNKKVVQGSFIYVLLKAYRIPHSFFKYIFLNESKFKSGTIPREVLLHEETHAKQLHSLDIITLELLQILFWFHPLVYILKHHVKLNHEFLADEAVLNEGTDTKNYQTILLQFSSPDSYRDGDTQSYPLSSAINYSSFKKRFTVMKTQTSKIQKWLSTLLLLPITAVLFYSFAERKEVVKPIENPEANLFLVTVEKNNNTIELRCESGCKWSHISLEPKATPYIINDHGFSEGKTIDSDKFAFSITPTDIGVELNGLTGTAWIDLAFSLRKNKRQAINQLGMTVAPKKYVETSENHFSVKAKNDKLFINGEPSSTNTYKDDLNFIMKDWTAEDFKSMTPDLDISECSQAFLDKLDAAFRKSNYFLIAIEGSKTLEAVQNDAVIHYNKIYRIYKQLRDSSPHYINKTKEEQQKMEVLFSDLGGMYFRMSKANKAKVKRPIAPVYPYTKITLNGKTYYKEFKDLTQEEKATLPPPPPPAKKTKGGPNFEDTQEVYNPSFLEYIIEMEQSGASFYLDGNKITSEKAKSIAKNNKGKQTEMLTQKDANGNYVVKLSSSKEVQQQNATKEQVAAYNKIARHYNSMIANGGHIQIQKKDVEKLKYIYGLMSEAQRKNAEPFPDFPEPPPAPTAPEPQKIKVKEVKAVKRPEPPKPVKIKAVSRVEEAEVPAKALSAEEKKRLKRRAKVYKEKHPEAVKKLKKTTKDGKVVQVEEIEVPSPPPPPPTPSPLDYVIKMAKTNAIFYYDSKQVSSDKAIALLKKNPELNIRATKTDTKQPVVYISKRPIVIEVKEKKRN